MKQTMKRLLVCTMAILMLMTLPVTTKAQAEVEDNLPERCRIYTSDIPYVNNVKLTLKDTEKTIENVKSGSSKLKAELGASCTTIHKESGDVINHSFTIDMIPLEDGKYTVSYDIVKDKKVVATNKIEVYAYPSPIKSVTLDGKEVRSYGRKTKAKIKVNLASGNTIKKLEVGTYKIPTDADNGQKQAKMVYKTFKNGDSVKLGTIGYYRHYGKGDRLKDKDYYDVLISSLNSYTEIKITYKDKYTKQDVVVTKAFYGIEQ